MKRKLMFFMTFLFIGIGLATAQTSKVTGLVTSEEDGQPVVGASVLVNGTTLGTITDIDGKFTISNVPSSSKTLRVSYVGMLPQEVTIKEGILKIVLRSDAKALDEVVVTALGIKRSEKILGYAASTVKNDDLVAAKSGSVMSGLSGKIAGVNISSSGTAGSSQKVIVRGYSSFSSNQPLYVIDGVPMSNNTSLSNDQGNGVIEASDAIDFGNGANDINPDDVESVTVLKGASATALYGSRRQRCSDDHHQTRQTRETDRFVRRLFHGFQRAPRAAGTGQVRTRMGNVGQRRERIVGTGIGRPAQRMGLQQTDYPDEKALLVRERQSPQLLHHRIRDEQQHQRPHRQRKDGLDAFLRQHLL